MNNKILNHSERGFALLAVMVALAIIGSVAAALAVMVASNNRSNVRQSFSSQGLYLTQAGIEYSNRNTKALNKLIVPSRQLMGVDLQITSTPVVTQKSRIGSLTYKGKNGDIARNSMSVERLENGSSCVYLLGSGSGALNIVGTASFTGSSCGININSTSSSALTMNGTADFTASYLNIAGNYLAGSNATITTASGTVSTGASTFTDPMIDIPSPSYSSCNYNNFSVSGTATLNPGVYCGGLTMSGTGTITMNPGTYIIDGGPFKAAGGPNITGNGVTIVLDGKISGNYATLDVSGSGTRSLIPPTTGTYSQVTVYQSRNAPSNSNTMTGAGALTVNGIVYLPNQLLTFGGNASSGTCATFVVGQLKLIGTSYLGCS